MYNGSVPTLALISVTFFPHPVVAAIRPTAWARLLSHHGWNVRVVCRHYGYDATAGEIEPVQVAYLDSPRAKPRQVTATGRSAPTLRRALVHLAPAVSAVFWARHRRRVAELCADADAVLTTSPPHSIHEAGRWAAQKLGVPWVADFRDPYLIDPRYRPSGWGRILLPLHERYERMIYTSASAVLHAIPAQTSYARERYPQAAGRVHTVANGYPPELGDTWRISPPATTETTILSVGVLCPHAAVLVARAIASLHDSARVRLSLVGPVPETADTIRQILGDRFVAHGPVEHRAALEHLSQGHILLSALTPERSRYMGLSSRLYEYLATSRPVIALNPTIPDQQLLASMPRVQMLHAPTSSAVRAALERALSEPREPLPAPRLPVSYSRERQVATLASILDALIQRPRPSAR